MSVVESIRDMSLNYRFYGWVTLCVLVLSGCTTVAHFDEPHFETNAKTELVRKELGGVIRTTTRGIGYVYQALFRQIADEPIWERVPKPLHPFRILNDKVTESLTVETYSKSL